MLMTRLPSWPAWLKFTSVRILRGTADYHFDTTSVGTCATVSVGSLSDGELWSDGVAICTHGHPHSSDGESVTLISHSYGTRYAVVAFIDGSTWKLQPFDIARLFEMGFVMPDVSLVRRLATGRATESSSDSEEDLALLQACLVPNGLGTPKGLTMIEHIEWAKGIEHPFKVNYTDRLEADQRAAIEFECTHLPTEIDAFRTAKLEDFEALARSLEPQREVWMAENGLRGSRLAEGLHGPFVAELIDQVGYTEHDEVLAYDFAGFPFVGAMRPSGPDAVPCSPKMEDKITVDELIRRRRETNMMVVENIRETEWDSELYRLAEEEHEFGSSSAPTVLLDSDLDECNLRRRIPIREERAKGWRTRPVDHMTECLVNPATLVHDKASYDSVHVLVVTLLSFMAHNCRPRMWKRDVEKGFQEIAHSDRSPAFRCERLPFC